MNLTKPKTIPAGTYFAYIKSDEQDIFLMREVEDYTSKQENRILRANSNALQDFEFSPDGRKLFCTTKASRQHPDDVSLSIVDQDGSVRRFDGFTSVFASWLHDGSKLLVRSHTSSGDRAAVWVLDVNTWERLDVEKPTDLYYKLSVYDPEFLVTFKKQSFNERSVFGVDEDGQEVELLREKHEIRELKFSPDRKKLAYFYSYPYYKWILGWRIVLLDLKTLNKSTVFDGVAESLFRLRWSPDSQGLSFICGISGIPNNRLMDMDLYETMGGYAPDLMGNTYIVFNMSADGSRRREIVRDCWKFDWIRIEEFKQTELRS
ncbi:MAG: hypothetical protein FJZ01_03970 [Candidatus Sericytochromatia bacterium]|nr:hypothetical protein [Candidatus Tanganyikabacteria bacterium]